MKKCKTVRVKTRRGRLKTEYRYGCDACAEALMKSEGGVVKAYTRDHTGYLYCPYDVCPYKDEIESHSVHSYEEYDRCIGLKWKRMLKGIDYENRR